MTNLANKAAPGAIRQPAQADPQAAPAPDGGGQRRVMALVMDAGSTLLENGGEVFRVQQTMTIMAQSLGLRGFHVYVLTNGIFGSAEADGATEVRHLPAVSIHLGRVERVNALSRQVAAGRCDLAGAERELAAIRALPNYRGSVRLLAAATGAACFAWLFGGNLAAIPVAFLAGAAELALTAAFQRRRISRIFSDIAAAACGTALVLLAAAAVPGVDTNAAIIGALMVLTPGVALVMGIRDFINADYLSGTIRLIDAVLIAGSLAVGVGFTYTVWRAVTGVVL